MAVGNAMSFVRRMPCLSAAVSTGDGAHHGGWCAYPDVGVTAYHGRDRSDAVHHEINHYVVTSIAGIASGNSPPPA
ncbi:MAG: hypothetical protein ACOC9Y_06110 [Chloroflexota bacterium]